MSAETRIARRRRGFVLAVMLWVIVLAGTMAAAGALSARQGVGASRNRVNAIRAHWTAVDCASRVQTAIDTGLAGVEGPRELAARWRSLARQIEIDRPTEGVTCEISVKATGSLLDVNAADSAQLFRLLSPIAGSASGALVDAILDWRDVDALPRALGAEADWYAGVGRVPPRNGPIVSAAEILSIRGLDAAPQAVSLLTTEPGRVTLSAAEPAVLATVPGLTPALIERICERRAQGGDVTDLLAIAATVGSDALDTLVQHFPDVVRLTVPDPEAWILTVQADAGHPAVRATIELRLVRVGGRAIPTRQRVW
jgi:type II secretory pathway component PulK